MKKPSAAFLAVVIIAAIGCGGGGSGFSPSVPSDKPLGSLSTSDATKLCMDTASYLMSQTKALETKENQCRITGLALAALAAMDSTASDAMLQQACQAGYQLCETAPADGGFTTDVDAGTSTIDCSNPTIPATCTATVAQYSACVNEQTAAIQSLFVPCNQLTKAKLMTFSGDDGGASTSGPACAAFQAACPGISMMASALRN
jgi:hypothetical protein